MKGISDMINIKNLEYFDPNQRRQKVLVILLNSGRWILKSGPWTLGLGLWTLESGFWTVKL